MSNSAEKKFLNALLLIPGVGYYTALKIREYFYSYETAWRADLAAFETCGIEKKIAERIVRSKNHIDPDLAEKHLHESGATLITAEDTDFPALLKEIPAPPYWLYIKGKIPNDAALAIVGSRKATNYGLSATNHIVSGLARMTNITIVSGLAMGIDEAAHRSAIKCGLKTIAVVGSGLDEQSLFPPRNVRLAREIIEKDGAVISEYPLGMPAFKQNFIQRNRIIAGLAQGTLVVEAADRSGALITARYALEHGRSVMAVPGSMFSPYSSGTNSLIAEGASSIVSAEDLMEEMNLPLCHPTERQNDLTDENEKNVLDNLGQPRRVDELKKILNINTPDIVSRLSMLELKGLVKNIGGGIWIKL